MADVLLQIEQLTTLFRTEKGAFPAISNLNLTVRKGEIVCIVGESGSGKTVASLSVMRLLPPAGSIASGAIRFEGRNLLELNEREMRDIRGSSIAMIFQDPMMALDPVYTCGEQIMEAIRTHRRSSRKEQAARALELLKQVGIPHPERVLKAYPHELSGGMCQRVGIAMALACNPRLLIADEPTTALDVTVQAQILDLLKSIRREFGMSILMITHDLGVVAEMADRVAVMYAGQIVEEGDVRSIFREPRHPYTQGLIRSMPHPDHAADELYSIPGTVPGIAAMPTGCRFHPRCPACMPICGLEEPPIATGSAGSVRCWLADQSRQNGAET
jgi:oligopeptide/dipeptide ABC transporter ATP-binding protein